MQESIQTAIEFITSTHPYIQATIILVATLFVALIALPFIGGIVRYLTRKTETDVDDQLIAALHTPLLYTALLIGVVLSLPLLSISAGVLGFLTPTIKTLFVFVIAQAVLRVNRILIKGASDGTRIQTINTQTLPLFTNISFIVISAAAIYGMFIIWGINVTAWLASAGILGIAIGFAAKDTLANIISGVFILTDKPYSINDFVVLGSGITGIVTSVGLRSTRIRTFDDEEVTIPNATIANEAITNKTTGPRTGRVKVSVGVAYGSNVDEVKEMLLDIANAHEEVIANPEPGVFLTDFGDSSLDFLLSCRVASPLDAFRVKSELRERINSRFAESGIEIPFPQRDVNIKK